MADAMTALPVRGVENFVPMVMASLEKAATMHHCHTPEIRTILRISGDVPVPEYLSHGG